MSYTALKKTLYRLGLDDKAALELSLFVRGVPRAVAHVLSPAKSVSIARGSYLHLGCGATRLNGFVNVDRYRTPATDLVIDIRRSLPFPEGTVAGIFHEHFLEHVDLTAARTLLAESFRVLMPGGFLRFGVPDLERFLQAYRNGDREFASTVGLDVYEFPAQIVNFVFAHAHRFVFDFQALRYLLEAAGFVDIREASLHDSADPMLNQENRSASRVAQTLMIEARKP